MFNKILDEIKAEKLAAIRFQKTGHNKYRDRITVYMDGKILFERFCYGEAAGLVLSMWGNAAQPIVWHYDKCNHSQKNEAPKALDVCEQLSLMFDGKNDKWECTEKLKSDSKNGYSRVRVLLWK
ncbi:MAG: hypothetical protein RR573_03745 [Oscillospiraceae bacterium]